MTKLSGSDSKSTLYCSFCGKSQHEVRTLIAGPTVFICNECTELCEDIIWDQSEGRLAVKIRTPPNTPYDELFHQAIGQVISEHFPGSEFRFEYRLPDEYRPSSPKTGVAIYSITRGGGFPNPEALRERLADLATELSVMTRKFVHQSQRVEILSAQLAELKIEYLEHLRSVMAPAKEPDRRLCAVMFLDISGFSRMEEAEKTAIVDMLRAITPTFIGARGGHEINMWGDAIVAIFDDHNSAVASAVKFLRHLSVEHMDARIGMAWGEIRTAYNPATARRDVDGAVVDFAARLEPMAPLGGILLSSEFKALRVDEALGTLVKVTRPVKKAFADYAVGDELELYEFKARRN